MNDRGVALVTGAGRRLGRALAVALSEAGWAVAVHSRSADQDAQSVADEIRSRGGRAAVVVADLEDRGEVSRLVPAARSALGPLTLLINSASLFEDDRMGRIAAEGWDRHMQINLYAPVMLAQDFAAQVPNGGDPGIINILDQRVLHPNPQFFSYTLSKVALAEATRTMAQALAPKVRVNGVAPGPTLRSIHQSETEFSAEAGATPLGRGSPPNQIIAAALYLASANSVTGHILPVDGGQHIAWKTPDILAP